MKDSIRVLAQLVFVAAVAYLFWPVVQPQVAGLINRDGQITVTVDAPQVNETISVTPGNWSESAPVTPTVAPVATSTPQATPVVITLPIEQGKANLMACLKRQSETIENQHCEVYANALATVQATVFELQRDLNGQPGLPPRLTYCLTPDAAAYRQPLTEGFLLWQATGIEFVEVSGGACMTEISTVYDASPYIGWASVGPGWMTINTYHQPTAIGMAHEIGHLLGLAHTTETGIMNDSGLYLAPGAADVQAVRQMWGMK